ncbi:MAG: DUF3604 domain-containing protein [bacterium]|nr:DUF3604 domain-containing protein [bacterium]
MKRMLFAVLLLAAFLVLLALAAGRGWFGQHEGPGIVTNVPIPSELLTKRDAERSGASLSLDAPTDKQVLFGDLHVHTTISADAFLLGLPILSGEGAHPQSDACDFARYCSALDFWSINDHAETFSQTHWEETIESIRQCNAVAHDPDDPDVVAFLGWEWTQKSPTPETHFGHRNVILRHTDDARIPARAIGPGQPERTASSIGLLPRVGFIAMARDQRSLDFARYFQETDLPICPEGVPVRDLPLDCRELTTTPAELYAKLDDWGVDSIVIPHGTAWGSTAPPGSTWDKQVGTENDDPNRQTLVEVHSGHGNSEQWRPFDDVAIEADGSFSCPGPQPGYLPSCWRAGEIIRQRCLDAEESAAECEKRAVEARQFYLEGGKRGYLTVPGSAAEDWLDAGQCSDCFLPAFDYRPKMSVQYMLTRRNFDVAEAPPGRRYGFISSSDVHTARPGTGYKEINRRENTEASGPRPGALTALLDRGEPIPRARRAERSAMPFTDRDTERAISFLTTGGLVAVHAEGRNRDSVWEALERREVYGTSGDRILLWFDLLGEEDAPPLPMGSDVIRSTTPRFRVRAAGSLTQKPGCPDYSGEALGPKRLHDLCRGECYNPGDERRRITRIEVVRLRPQSTPDEPLSQLIDDPWRILPCPDDPAGCTVEFADETFTGDGRHSVYYVRAIQEPTEAVNGGGLRCARDERGNCIEVTPCRAEPYEDDCLAPIEERAWSSPIFIDWSASPSAPESVPRERPAVGS